MGRKSSLTTRSKRRKVCTTPPATPFNSTSFLIQLQQLRDSQHRASPGTLKFDQYGSMVSMFACCSSSFATPASPQNRVAQSSSLSIRYKESSQSTNFTIQRQSSSDPDGLISGINQSSGTELKLGTDPEMHEGDGVLTARHRQHSTDNLGKQARGSGASNSMKK